MPNEIMEGAHFIGGEWDLAPGSERISVIDPATEEVYGTVPRGTAEDVDRAVKAAEEAFAHWSETTPGERADVLERAAALIRERAGEIGEVISHELGSPITAATGGQVMLTVAHLDTAVAILREWEVDSIVGNAVVVREPIGPVGAITPWNFPMNQVSVKVVPAIAAGCTVVLKPAEATPLAAGLFAQALADAGLPAGVFNIVNGKGSVVGEAITTHPDLAMVSFTGSTEAGKRVAAAAAGTVKRVALELGGKSANVVLDDADFEKAVTSSVNSCFSNSGQVCTALTRLVVPRSRLGEVERIALDVANKVVIGEPSSEETTLGPLISGEQRESVRGYITGAIDEGARLITGGADDVEGMDRGYYVKPTIFSDVTRDMTIAKEEVFGPVLAILAYDDEDEAVEIANDSIYGLSGAVWSGSTDHASAIARRLRTGRVQINGAFGAPTVPFGGYKQSGIGREWGAAGIEEYLETKAIIYHAEALPEVS